MIAKTPYTPGTTPTPTNWPAGLRMPPRRRQQPQATAQELVDQLCSQQQTIQIKNPTRPWWDAGE